MSSGAQIGGIIGGVAGFFMGNPQLGYMIGSAIGGYVDPQKNYGPRLDDASSQTSTVGGVIPFGYGVFTTAGNVIWAADLVEHRKSERAGKGGGQKNYTYTYTRSYAVGVCKGPISAYLWVKRNGKLIYAADPQGLGAAMGWTGEQIADLVEASSKFRQIATLYYGTERQMPDSTITAVEGVGNVAPHRGLAYIVLENDDVTDLRGAVGQFEFCVKVGAARSYTTPPYSVHVEDGLTVTFAPNPGALREDPVESFNVTFDPLDGQLREIVQEISTEPEVFGINSLVLLDGTLEGYIQHFYDYGSEEFTVNFELSDGNIKETLVTYSNYEPEACNISPFILLDGTLI